LSDIPIYALVIYGVGCIIPTPLDQAPPEPNYRPVIVTSAVSPPFGPLPRLASDLVEIHVAAEDANQNDQLEARLFVQIGNRLTYTGFGIQLNYPTVPDSQNPLLRSGDFIPLPLCRIYSGTNELVLAVADRPFDGQTDQANGGLTDENHWELQCM
jgi:hypothetical protein